MHVRQQRLIVGNSYVEANVPELGGVAANNWVSGAIQVFKEDLTALTAAESATYQGPIYIGQYEAVTNGLIPEEQVTVDSTKLVGPIAKEAIRPGSYKYCAYDAPVNQAEVITLPTPVNGLTYTFVTKQTNDHEDSFDVKNYYEITADATITTVDELGDCFVKTVNDDRSAVVTASYAGGDLTLTSKNFRSYFVLGLRKDLVGSAVASTAANDGVGSYSEVFAIEDSHERGNAGSYNRVEYVADPGFQSSVDRAGNYDLFIIEYNDKFGSDGISKGLDAPKAITIAIDSLGTGNAALQTLLEAWLDLAIDNRPD